MVKTETELKRDIQDFVKRLKDDNINVSKAVLFGSYARGNPHEDSDIDLAIISPDFSKMGYIERLEFLGRKALKHNHLLEPLGYSPQEFSEEDTPSPLISLIRNTGKVIYDSGSVQDSPGERLKTKRKEISSAN